MNELSERRAHRRHPVSFAIQCRRLGPRRAESTEQVDVVDLSLGGMRITAPSWADLGNVLEIELDGVGLRGLVVGLSGPGPDGGATFAHVAFGSLTSEAFGTVLELLDTHVDA